MKLNSINPDITKLRQKSVTTIEFCFQGMKLPVQHSSIDKLSKILLTDKNGGYIVHCIYGDCGVGSVSARSCPF